MYHIDQAPFQLHPHRQSVTLLPYVAVIRLHFKLYLPWYTSVYILFLQFIFISMEPTASQTRNHYLQKNQTAHLERALACAFKKAANLQCRSNVWTSNSAFNYSVGDRSCWGYDYYVAGWWQCQSGDQQEWKYRPWTAHPVMELWRRWFGPPAGGSTSRSARLWEDNTNAKASTTNETEGCGYCHCMHFTSKSATSSFCHRTTIAQTPNVNYRYIMRLWHCTHPGHPAFQVWWR